MCASDQERAPTDLSAILYGICVFESLWGGGLGATYNDHLRLIGKRVINFLLLIKLFFARCYH